MVVAQHVPQLWSLIGLRCSHRQWVVQVLTISKLKRWSIIYHIATPRIWRARLYRSEALPSDASDWMDSLTWCDAPWERRHSNFYTTVNPP